MISLQKQTMLKNIKSQCLVVDIETSAHYSNDKPVNIGNCDDYVDLAVVKWFGCYSYKYNKQYYLNAVTQQTQICALLQDHDVIVSFNGEEFDYPILQNNGLLANKRYTQVDCMHILGKSVFKNSKGYGYKDRGSLMGYKFKNNKLSTVAEEMKLEHQKGEIDYGIFNKTEWTDEETKEIVKYLNNDVMATKGMFDKLWNYWMPFTEMIDVKHIKDLSWVKNSIASLTYKSACYFMGVEPTYAEKGSKIEEMGGRVIIPKYEEARKVWYIDFASLYPHIFCMFNLFNETSAEDGENIWSGNEIFKVKGKYNVEYKHPLVIAVEKRLKERIKLKEIDPDNPMIYTLKIWLNALYGCARSAIFEQIHTDNCGWDCCWLGQQIHELTEDMMKSFGFETIAGDTDGLMVVAIDEKNNNREYVIECLNQIIEVINDNVPFPVSTFKIDIEEYIDYIMYAFSEEPLVEEETRKLLNKKDAIVEGYETIIEDKKKVIVETASKKVVKRGRSWIKERVGKKKNYLYIYQKDAETKVKIMGLPIKKDNATLLAMKIYNEVLEPRIIKEKYAKFDESYINGLLEDYLKRPDTLKLLSREFKIKTFDSYKSDSCIYAQISKGYFDGGDGIIRLLKNNKIGKAGKGDKYCTVQEAIDAKLTVDDIDLEKVHNELNPFIRYEEKIK